MESYLDSKCWKKPEGYCRDPFCSEAVKEAPNGRWFITMGHAGFNNKVNNHNGYVSEKAAYRAVRILLNR